ncbi:MAG: hypothetical protein U1E60_09015 [Reyranellaceae bacterium]
MTSGPILVDRASKSEQDIVHARQRARQIARSIGFDRQAQTCIATAVSEIARNTVVYATVEPCALHWNETATGNCSA